MMGLVTSDDTKQQAHQQHESYSSDKAISKLSNKELSIMDTTTYGYGHTKEAASLVREALKTALAADKVKYDLKVSVKKADSGYGGPRVDITTTKLELDKRYEYIVNSDGSGIGDGPGKLESKPVSEFTYGRPHHSARLVTPAPLEELNSKIKKVLSQFGKDNDDAMTDYFDNTMPLFYGVSYKEGK